MSNLFIRPRSTGVTQPQAQTGKGGGRPARTEARPGRGTRPTGARTARDLPLAAVLLSCGHTAREYGLMAGDWLWCQPCVDQARVVEVLAT